MPKTEVESLLDNGKRREWSEDGYCHLEVLGVLGREVVRLRFKIAPKTGYTIAYAELFSGRRWHTIANLPPALMSNKHGLSEGFDGPVNWETVSEFAGKEVEEDLASLAGEVSEILALYRNAAKR